MSLTIITQPDEVMLGKNHMLLRLQTNNQWSTSPVKSEGRILVPFNPLAEDTLLIEWGDESHHFTFKSSVGSGFPNTAYYILIHTGPSSIQTWIEATLIPTLNRTYAIFSNFVLSYNASPEGVNMTAREYGPELDLTITGSGDVTGTLVTAGVTGVQVENMKMYCDVWVEDAPFAGTFTKRNAQLEAAPDPDGYGEFRLDRALTFEESYPPTSALYTCLASCEPALKRYLAVWGEKYGSPITLWASNPINFANAKSVIAGAVGYKEFPTADFYNTWLNASTNKFLTQMPRTVTVPRDIPMWLYYYGHHTTTATVKIKCYYADGTAATFVAQSGMHPYKKVISFPAGLQANIGATTPRGGIGILGQAEIDNTIKYQMWVEFDSSARRSETMTFLITEIPFEFNRFLLFKNSLGGYDTVWCHAGAENSSDFTGEEIRRTVAAGYSSRDRAIMQYGKSYTDAVMCSTGYKGREEGFNGRAYINYLRDLLLSDDAFEWLAGGPVPIVVDAKTEEFPKQMETMNSKVIKYRYAFDNVGYSS